MPFFKLEPVTPALKFCPFFRWNRRFATFFIYVINKFPTIITPVSQNIAVCDIKVSKHQDGIFDIVALSFAYDNTDWIA